MTGMAAYTPGKGSGNTRQESMVSCPNMYVGMSVVSYGVHMSARLYVYMSLVCICIYGPTCTCVRTIDMHVSALLTCMRLVGVACVLCAHGRVRATVPSGVPNTRGTLR